MADNNESPDITPRSRVPRLNATPESASDPAHLEQLANLMDSVKVLANQLGAAPTAPPDPAQERAARRPKKFQRRSQVDERRPDASGSDPAGASDSPAAASDEEEDAMPPEGDIEAAVADQPVLDSAARNKSIAWPRLTKNGRPLSAPGSKQARRPATAPLLVLMAVNLAILIFGYWFGQAAAGGASGKEGTPTPGGQALVPTAPPAAQDVDDRAVNVANAALKAEKADDGATARHLYEGALQQRVNLPGADYRLALLAIRRNDLLDADLHLIHSTTAGENVAACYYIRSTFAGNRGNYAEAARQLEAAARAQPFSSKYYFYWGESLRRQGKPHAAAACLEQALDRPYTPEEGELYLFKLRLAKIEAGEDDFNKELASHLQDPPVAGDWWLLAAAQDLGRSDFNAAAGHLQKASHAMSAALFESRILDYVYQTHVKRPELASYLNRMTVVPPTEAGNSVMDPASWPADKGDPGAWPSDATGGK